MTTVALLELVGTHAPWLLAAELGVAVVGTTALAEACRRAGLPAPTAGDLDLAWALDVEAGDRLLRERGLALPITANSRERGTLAFRLGGERIEITSYRGGGDGPVRERLERDLWLRECTIAAIAWSLVDDEIVDPCGGLQHWRERRLEPCGDARERVAEHPIRLLRAYRRAFAWGLRLAPGLRRLRYEPAWLEAMPAEAIAAELRRALLELDSPGRLFVELFESGILAQLAPELAPQFDGRPAGPQRHHPELSQALHLVLGLEWAARRSRDRDDDRRGAILVAVLCHDLGKGSTPPAELPSHPGHEERGVASVGALLDRLPGLTDAAGRRLAEQVCRLHLAVRRLDDMRPGTLAGLYDEHFRANEFPVDDFALAIGADVGGRLGCEAEGEAAAAQVAADLRSLRAACASVDGRALRERFPDLAAFRNELHAARARAIRRARGQSVDAAAD
ncbi:MAG: hypothetical protein IPM29_31185 [Planctomycetes bacterium]|nr:hypothetical protein [Planctomycetota bacterium]